MPQTQPSTSAAVPKGGQFLMDAVGAAPIFSPDDFTPDDLALGRTASDFLEKELIPFIPDMEKKDYARLMSAFKKGGELGFYMTAIPEKWGGLGLPKVVTALLTEKLAGYGSFSVTQGAHMGIGTLPIVYFGSPEQKARYLPRLATGELMGAYALSEPGSGSDAQSAKTTAVLNEAGTHYVVNGTKQWITNGALADVFIVFVQVVDAQGAQQFSALIVERGTPGFTHGKEEHKLGLRGSSTTPLILENALVPVENLLGQVGRGHDIAFNILNVGRFKLAVGVTGGAKLILKKAIAYAKDRKQFKRPVMDFGALRQKVAEAASEIWAMESASYRITGLTDLLTESLGELGEDAPGTKKMAPIQEYAIEASICKVWCSEAINRIASECLQMYGGYGYVEDYPAELAFRDSRINMIFEGTNEINRLLIPGMLLKRAMTGRIPLMPWLGSLERGPQPMGTGPLAAEADAVQRIKGIAGLLLQTVAMKYMQRLEDEQELLLLLAELVMEAYITDSAVARSLKRHHKGLATPVSDAMTRVVVSTASDRVRMNARRLACSVLEGDALEAMLQKLAAWDPPLRTNLVADRRLIADAVVEAGGYNQSPA